MKKRHFFNVGLILLFIIKTASAQYITLEGKQFRLNGEDFYPLMTNYSVETIWDQTTNETFVAPNHCYDTSFIQEGNSKASCLGFIQRDFNYIAGMGFNGVRFYSFFPKFNKNDSTFVFYRNSYDTSEHDSIFLDPGNPQDTCMQIVYTLYDQLLEIANNTVNNITNQPSPLKVIFIINGYESNFTDYEIEVWNDYLNALSEHLNTASNNSAMFAYDLINEPCYSVRPIKTKTEACEMISSWNSTIKANDKKHLVTIGSCGFDDVSSFDPSILKVDFYSLHIYPYWKTAYEDRQYDSIQKRAWQRTLNQCYWMEHNANRPWMVGEAGLSASINYSIDSGNMDGSLADQAGFASHNLNGARNCGASGYSWAGYQDVKNSVVINPKDLYGLIERFNVPSPLSEKPAVDTFRYWNYVPDTCQICCPENYDSTKIYFNPYLHQNYESVSKNGLIIAQANKKVHDAVIEGIAWISSGDSTTEFNSVYEYNQTFSDSKGYFKIIPYDYWGNINDSAQFIILNISAGGSDILHYEYGQIPSNNYSYYLNRIEFSYHYNISNIIIDSNDHINFKGFYEASVSDFTVKGFGSTAINASCKISLRPGFSALKNSTTHLFISDTAYTCSDYSWPKNNIENYNYSNLIKKKSEIELLFLVSEEQSSVKIFPNPTKETITIFLNNEKANNNWNISIRDIFGSEIFAEVTQKAKITMNLGNCSRGIYFLSVRNSDSYFIKKIILN